MFYKILRIFLSPLIKFFWVGTVKNIEKVPQKGPIIICANHNSYLDFFILSSITSRRLYFLAGEVFFKKKLWRPLVALTGQIRVDRDSKDKESVYLGVKQVLNKGKALGIFPEGTRSRDGNMQKGYNGAVKFAHKYNVNILPVGISGAFKAWPPHKKVPKLSKCDVKFGESYSINSDDYDFETENLMKKIAQLSNDVKNE